MLIYHPAFDAYHCVFRMLALLSRIDQLEIDRARIFDFYLAFPSALAKVRLPNQLTDLRKTANAYANIYRDPINPPITFRDMRFIQEAAIRCIAACGLVSLEHFEKGMLKRSEIPIPIDLARRLSLYAETLDDVLNALLTRLAAVPLRGPNGLKDRTGLLEYRYDVA